MWWKVSRKESARILNFWDSRWIFSCFQTSVGTPAEIFLVSKQSSGLPLRFFLFSNSCRDSRWNFSCFQTSVGTPAEIFLVSKQLSGFPLKFFLTLSNCRDSCRCFSRFFPSLSAYKFSLFCWVCLVSALKNYNDVAVDCQRRLFHVLAIGIKKLLSGSFSLITESRFRTAIIKILFLYPMKKSNTSCAVRMRKNMVRGYTVE